MRKIGVAAVVMAVVAGVVWYLLREPVTAPGAGPDVRAGAGEPPLVLVAAARRELLLDTVDALGTAQANESVTLTAKVTDTVSHVNFEDGDYVEAGHVLIELTNREDEALLAEARANLEDAKRQLQRIEELAGSGLSTASELDMARARAEGTQARYNTVVARLSDRLIQAPFSGVLGFRTVSPGTLVTPNTPITTIDDIATIKLDFTVPETFLSVMQPGARVYAKSASWPEREFEGEVRTVGSRVDPVTRAIVVRAHLLNSDGALRPGMLLTVRVVMAEREALTVPEGAVFELRDQAYVFGIGADRVARQLPVEVGDRRFGTVEITAGLAEGDLVVTEGTIKLRDGMRVRLPETHEPVSGGAPPPGRTEEPVNGPRAAVAG